jgi:hypothetical protein
MKYMNWLVTEFTPDYFEMYVTNAFKGRLHRFTSFSGSPHLADLHLPKNMPINSGTWAPIGIALASSMPPSCPVIYAEASMAPTRTSLPSGAELGIEFSIRTDNVLMGDYFQRFECRTSFFERDKYLESITKPVEYDEKTRLLKCVPLGSQFWVRNIKSLTANKKMEKIQPAWNSVGDDTRGYGNGNVPGSQSKLNGLTAVQEITASPVDLCRTRKEEGKKRLLVLFWRFCLTQENTPGETTWRHVHFGYTSSSNMTASVANGFGNMYTDVPLSPVEDIDSGMETSFHEDLHSQHGPMPQLSPLELDFLSQPIHQSFDLSTHQTYNPDVSAALSSLPTGITSTFAEFGHQPSDLDSPAIGLPSTSVPDLNMHQFETDHTLDITTSAIEPIHDSNLTHSQHHEHQDLSMSLTPLATHHQTSSLFSHHHDAITEDTHPQGPSDTASGASIAVSTSLFDDSVTAQAWTRATAGSFLPSTAFYDGHSVDEDGLTNVVTVGFVGDGVFDVEHDGDAGEVMDIDRCIETVVSEERHHRDGQEIIVNVTSDLEDNLGLGGEPADIVGGLTAAEALQKALGLTRSGIDAGETRSV